jgi:hypothetical protein
MYRDIANKVREHLGVPKDQSSDFDSMFHQAIGEAVGMVIPKVLEGGKFAADYVGAKLAGKEGERVAGNIATMNQMKNQGMPVSTTAVFKGTEYDPDLQTLKNNPNMSDTQRAIETYADAQGRQVDKEGNIILSEENTLKQREDVGSEIGQMRKQVGMLQGDKTIDPAPMLQIAKERFNKLGIKSVNGEIPESASKNLSGEQKAFATKWNDEVQRIKEIYLKGNTGTTIDIEMLKHQREPVPAPKENFNGGEWGSRVNSPEELAKSGSVDAKAAASHQDTIPGQQMNTGAPMEVSSSSNPLSGKDAVNSHGGTQGSLGLAEQSDDLNKVIGNDANGKPVTRMQMLANTSHIETFTNDGVTTRGLSSDEIHRMTQDFQGLANIKGMNRTPTDKAFGSVANTLAAMRDEMTRAAYDNAASKAEAAGDTETAKMLRGGSDKMAALNERFGNLADAQPKLIQALQRKPDEAVNYMMKTMKPSELTSLVNSSTPETIGALKNMYVKNLLDDSSKGGVLMSPSAFRQRIYNDGSQLKILMGEEGVDNLIGLSKIADAAKDLDAKNAAGFTTKVLGKVNEYLGGSGSSGLELINNLFAKSPRIKRLIQDSPVYTDAFQRYYGSSSAAQRVADSGLGTSFPKASAGVAAAKIGIKSQQRSNQQTKELNMLDLENK